jgi:hypothetical protein
VVKVLLSLVAVWAGLRLWPQFVLLLLSLLVAVALHPVVTRLERRGFPRGAVVGLLTLPGRDPPVARSDEFSARAAQERRQRDVSSPTRA